MAPKLVIVADDLSGAADSAAPFCCSGLRTAVPLTSVPGNADVLSINTKCRDAGEHALPELFQQAISAVPEINEVRWWFQKIDSALRGHPGADIRSLMAHRGSRKAVVAPALPSEGRTTVNGIVLVHGELVHNTSLGDGLRSSSVSDVLSKGLDCAINQLGIEAVERGVPFLNELFSSAGDAIWIADAETDQHLRVIAEAGLRSAKTLLVGSAGLSRQVATLIENQSRHQEAMRKPKSTVGTLIVAGSRHSSTGRQIAAFESAGGVIVDVDFAQSLTRLERDRLVAALGVELRGGRAVALTSVRSSRSTMGGNELAAELGRIATSPDIAPHIGTMVLTGGEVAAEVFRQLGAAWLELQGEVTPAIPWGTMAGGDLDGTPFVVKAGSFGSDDTLLRCANFLRSLSG